MIETRPATINDLERASEVLADAFSDYLWTRWTIDPEDHGERIRLLQFDALRFLGLPLGLVTVTSVDGVIQSVAVWMSSETGESDSVHAQLMTRRAELEGSRHPASLAADMALADLRPLVPHLYLGTVGTSRQFQRQGLGRATLLPGIESADRDGLACYLETSARSNVSFYELLRFEIVGHRQIEGGPEVWAMLRPSRSTT
ncbi:MAG: N-acetyltransferase [Actinomycetota bacterium]